MSDIVERLGLPCNPAAPDDDVTLQVWTIDLLCEAAAEITRLRAELADCRAAALEEAAQAVWDAALSPSPAAPSSPEASDQSELPPGSAGQG